MGETSNPSPVMDWEETTPFKENVVWWSKLDDRFQVEVQRQDTNTAILIIFDHNNDDKVIYSDEVAISYTSEFGPDVADVTEWEEAAVEEVDEFYENEIQHNT